MTREERVLEDLLFHVQWGETGVGGVLTERGRVMMEAYYTINLLLMEKELSFIRRCVLCKEGDEI